jgi:predicted DNA-binding transcriptional regulator YafY
VYHPTTRVLTVLELLQSHRALTGAEIAERLEIDPRTVRRYIAMLDELGIPIYAERGRYGGYRLMPGYKLPPLMLSEEEALALTLGLLAARRMGLAAHAPAVEGALAKVERVLPEGVRNRVRAVEEAIAWDTRELPDTVPASVMLTLSTAARSRTCAELRYRRSDGQETRRTFDPYGLACQQGRWYATGYCHLRSALRLFRLDRIVDAVLLEERFERPAGFDVLDSVLRSLGSVPRELPLEVVIHGSLEEARAEISVRVATLEEIEGGSVLLRGYTDSPAFIARLLARLRRPVDIRQPRALYDAIHADIAETASWAATAVRWTG